MTTAATYAVIQFVTLNGPLTQKQIAEALSLSQPTVSKIVRSTAGFVEDASRRPAKYSYDISSIPLKPVIIHERPNDTVVVPPPKPRHDTMAETDWPTMVKRIDTLLIEISRKGSFANLGKDSLANVSKAFDQIAYTILCRIEKGDFDGTNH